MSYPAADIIVAHIVSHLPVRTSGSPPTFVGIQGPQGSGKSTLTNAVQSILTSPPHSLHVAVLSVDDLYLTHDELVALAEANPGNGLLKGRGQPGTHDVALGTRVLDELYHMNESNESKEVDLPIFDKSLFNGEGDRSKDVRRVRGPIDVVILEGWCMGFYPISSEELEKRYNSDVDGSDAVLKHEKGSLEEVNRLLSQYLEWYRYFSVFIQIRPPAVQPYSYIYKWRLQQEHHMKSNNGGRGMTDEQVVAFVDRYIPGYVMFNDGVQKGMGQAQTAADKAMTSVSRPPWINNGLTITIDEARNVVDVGHF